MECRTRFIFLLGTICSLLASSPFSVTASDSDYVHPKMRFGFCLGPNNTQWLKQYYDRAPLNLNKQPQTNSLLGKAAGLFFEVSISKNSSLQLEFQAQVKAIKYIWAQYTYAVSSGTYITYTEFEDTDSFMRYSFPVLYKHRFGKFYIDAGPYWGLARYYVYKPVERKRLLHHKGIVLGAGCNLYKRKNLDLSLELRDDLELLKLQNTWHNFYRFNTIVLYIGVGFRLK